MLLAKFEFDGWFHFFKKQGIIKKNRIPPKTWWRHRDVMQMYMNGKVNQGPLYDINV